MDIVGNVAGTAQSQVLFAIQHLHDRHGRLRGNPGYPTPDVFVHHHVTDNENAATRKLVNPSIEHFRGPSRDHMSIQITYCSSLLYQELKMNIAQGRRETRPFLRWA
jgi:hypothetical protein